MKINPSARKHGIADSDILYAAESADTSNDPAVNACLQVFVVEETS